EPAEERTVRRAPLEQELCAPHPAGPRVGVDTPTRRRTGMRDDEVVELLVEALDRQVDVFGQLLLHADGFVPGDVGLDARRTKGLEALEGLRRLVKDADAALEGRPRSVLHYLDADRDARVVGPLRRVLVVVKPDAGQDLHA